MFIGIFKALQGVLKESAVLKGISFEIFTSESTAHFPSGIVELQMPTEPLPWDEVLQANLNIRILSNYDGQKEIMLIGSELRRLLDGKQIDLTENQKAYFRLLETKELRQENGRTTQEIEFLLRIGLFN